MTSRRHFVRCVSASGLALLVGREAWGQGAMLDEKDPTADALGYVADAAKANQAKFPQYKPGQKCSNCTLYTGKAGSAAGPCALFPGKLVAANGWCSAHVDK